jgi:hypothetical protein
MLEHPPSDRAGRAPATARRTEQMADNFDFLARLAIQAAELEKRAEWKLEDELEHELRALECEIKSLIERERVRREKYWEAMVQKRASMGG